jgi:hypothetical protein
MAFSIIVGSMGIMKKPNSPKEAYSPAVVVDLMENERRTVVLEAQKKPALRRKR